MTEREEKSSTTTEVSVIGGVEKDYGATKLDGGVRLSALSFSGIDADSTRQAEIDVGYEYETRRLDLAIKGAISRSTLLAEDILVDETLVEFPSLDLSSQIEDTDKTETSVSGNLLYRLSRQSSVGLQSFFRRQRFEDNSRGLVDSDLLTVRATYAKALNKTLNVAFVAGHSQFESDNDRFDGSDVVEFGAGFSAASGRQLNWSVFAGVQQLDTSTGTQDVVFGRGFLRREGRQHALLLLVHRGFYPTGNGTLARLNQVTGRVERFLGRSWTAMMSASYVETEGKSNLTLANVDQSYREISFSLNNRVGRKFGWGAFASYRRSISDTQGRSSATGYIAGINLRYDIL